jgi:sugar lactone lactonase YvrE
MRKSLLLLTTIAGLAAAVPASAANVAIYASDIVITTTQTRRLIGVDGATGAGNIIGTAPSSPAPSQLDGLAFDANTGTLYGVDTVGNDLYTVNPQTGAATLVGDLGVNLGSFGLTFDTNRNRLYLTSLSTNTNQGLYTVDPTTAAATLVGTGFGPVASPSTGVGINGLGYDPVNDMLYGVAGARNELYTIDFNLGTVSLVGSLGPAWTGGDVGVDFDPVNGLLLAINTVQDTLFTINTSSGLATAVGPLGIPATVQGLAAGAVVPLPAAAWLLLTGVAALGLRARRR